MNTFINLLKNRKKRLPAIIFYTFLFILICGLATTFALMNLRRDYLDFYTNLQQDKTNMIANSLEGLSEDEMVEYLLGAVPPSGSSFAYLKTNDEVIFLQSEYTTKHLRDLKDPQHFEKYLAKQEAVITHSTFGDGHYVCGIITDESYIFASGEIDTFEMYIIIIFSVLTIILGGGLIFASGILTGNEEKYDTVSDQLNERNEMIEKFERKVQIQENAQMLRERHQLPVQEPLEFKGAFYDLNILNALLDKSVDSSLYPITFLFVQIIMKDRYYTKEEILKPAYTFKEQLPDQCVLVEIARAHFVIVCYTVDATEIIPIKARLEALWETQKTAEDVDVLLHTKTLEIFENPREAFIKYNSEVWT